MKKHRNFILDFAIIAENEKVETFCIGTEMRSFVLSRPIFWTNLIDTIKTIYNGKLTYAANWDDFENVPFWNQLDYIGVDAYFPLSNEKNPTKKTLLDAWEPINKQLKSFSKKLNKQLLFTEFGYRSMEHSLSKPWESSSKQPVNMKNQQVGLAAFFETFWTEDYVAGGYLWKWFDKNEKAGGLKDLGYTPQNKPALKIITKWYSFGR